MAQSQKVESVLNPKVKPTLGLMGATVNAMALIAPGAFLWITYQLQAANNFSVGGAYQVYSWDSQLVRPAYTTNPKGKLPFIVDEGETIGTR